MRCTIANHPMSAVARADIHARFDAERWRQMSVDPSYLRAVIACETDMGNRHVAQNMSVIALIPKASDARTLEEFFGDLFT